MKIFIPTLQSVQNTIVIQADIYMPICNLIVNMITDQHVYQCQNIITNLFFVNNCLVVFQDSLIQILSTNFKLIRSYFLDNSYQCIKISCNNTILIQSGTILLEITTELEKQTFIIPDSSDIINKINDTIVLFKNNKLLFISQEIPLSSLQSVSIPLYISSYTKSSYLVVYSNKFIVIQNTKVIAEKQIQGIVTSVYLDENTIFLGLNDGRTQQIDKISLNIQKETAVQTMLHQKISGKCGPIIYAGKNLFASDTMVWRVSENRIDFFVPYHGNQAKISAGGILSSVFQPFSNEIRAVRPGISSQLGDCLVCGNGKDFSLYQGTMVEHIYFTEAIDFISLFRLDGEACIIACGKDKLYIRRQSQSDLYQLPLILQGRVQQVQGVTSSVFVVLSTSEILFYEFYSNQFRVLKAIKTSQVIKSLIYHPKGALLVFLENAQCCIYVYRDGDIFVSENTLFHPFIQNNITLDTTGLFLAYLQDGGVVFAETMSRQQVALLEAVGAEQLGFTTDNRLCFGGKYGFVIVRCPDAVADVVEGFLQNSIASGLSIEEVYDRHDMWLWN